MYDDAVKNKMFWNATPSFQEFQRRLQNPKYVQTVQANYRAHGRSGDAFDTLSGFRDYFCVSDEDKQDMTQGVGNMIADTKARLAGQQRYNKLKQFQDKHRDGLGFGVKKTLFFGVKTPFTNANVVREPLTGRYLTSDGAEYAQEFEAARAQNQLDETGKRYTEAVERGDLPSAFEVRDEDGNYALVEDLGVKPGVHVTEKGKQQQLAGLVNTRKSVEEQYNALYRKLEEDFKRSAPFSLNTHSQYGIDDNDMRLQAYLNSNAQYRRLKAQLHQLDNAIRVGEEAVKGRAEERYVKNAKGMLGYAYRDLKSFGASALRGLWNAVSDVSTWDMGLQDLQDNMTLYTTVKKARQKGYKNLNSEERQMLDVAAKTGAYTAENQQYLGRGYKAGNVTGESLPFMVEMALNPASGLGEAVMSKYMRNAIAKYGKEAVRKEAWKYVTKKCGYRIAGDVLGAALMTGTTGSARTLADTYDRLTGDIKSTYDSKGKIVYDGTENEEKGILKAYLKAFGATAIENHSEFVGEYFNPLLKGVGTLTMKGWKKVNAKSANAFLDNLKDMGSTSTAKWLGNLFDKTQWHGTIGEYAEEVVGNIENALLVGDSTLDTKEGTGVFNLDQNIDTFLGVSLMGGFFSTLKTGAYVRDKVKGERKILMQQSLDLDNSIRYALGADPRLADKWKEWRVALAQGTDEEKKQALKEISENTNGNIKKAMYDYSANAQKLAGMDKATQGAIEDGTITPEQAQRDADIEQAHEEGLAAEGTARHDIQQEHQLRENSLARMLGISAEQLDRMEDEDIESMTGQNDALDTAIYDYQTSRERYQGVIDRATDEVEQAGIDAAHQIDLYTDHSTGQIRPCVIKGNNGKEDYQGYIVNGNIATHPDGAIDVSGSDKMILYFDPETGKIEHGDASTFASLGESADATVARQQAIDEAKQQAAQAQSRDIDRGVGEDGNVSEAMPTFPQSSDQEERNAADFDIGQVVNAETGEVIPVSFEELAEGENAYLTGGRPDGKTKDRLKVTIVDAEGNVTNRMMKRGNVQVDGRMSAEDFRNAYEEAVSSRIAPEADMNGPENNVDEEGVVAGGAAPSADTAATSGEEGAASEPAVRDKNGNPIYDKMPISATIADLYDGALDDAEIDGFVSAQIAEAEKAVEKMEKKKPKVGTDKAKYLADKKAWEEGLQEAQRKVQYWQDVKAEVDKITTPEDARGYEEELNGDAAQAAYRNGSDAASYGVREVTAEFMQSGDVKITPESYRKETGFGAAEQRAMVGKISKGGKSIDKLAEDLEVFDRENYNGMYFGGDSSVAKDAILDYLSSPDSRKGVKKMQSEAEREYVEAYEAERDRYYQEKYHMSYEEYLVYSSQEMPELLRKYSNFDEQLFLERYADEIEAALQKREEQLKQEENGKEGNVSAGEESGYGRSNQVQSGERTDDTGRGEVGKDSAGEVGPRHEGVVESEAALGSGGSTNQQRIGRVQKETRADVADQTMTHDEAIAFIAAMENRAEVAPSVDLSIENWDSLFGLDGIVNTPIGKVKMGDNQFTKMMREDRHGKLGMVKPTLENPDAILEDASKAKAGDTEERPSSYIFVKAFKKSDGSRYYYFTSITVSKDGLEVVVSNQEKRKNAIANLLSKDKLVWKHADDVSDASDVAQGLYSSQGNVSDLATEGTDAPQTSMSNNDPTSSGSKDTNNTDTKQENEEKSAGGEKEPMSPTPAMIDRMIEEQRVDDVSELLISSELKKAAEGIAEAFGMKVVYLKKVFIKSDDPAVEDFEGNGFVRNGVIYLSLKEADIAQFTFGHELLHQLKQIDADSYMRIRQKVIDVMGRKAFEMEVKARQMTYANVPGYTLFEDYAEEVIADTLGDIITHTDMLPNIARSLKENPSLLDRFLNVVDNVRQYFRGKTGGALGDLVNDIRNTYEMTARQGAERDRTEAALDAVNDRFNDRLESLVANPNQKDKVLRLGRSSEFLKDGGVADAEIVLEFDKLVRKSGEDYKNKHPFDMSDIKDLPKAIASPIAVFGNTSGENDGNVILTELKKDGKNFIVAVKTVMQPRKGGVVLEVNQITTLFPKEAKGIVHWFNLGKATNIDKEKALRFIEALPTHPGTTIKAEELISAANVVKDFVNSKESDGKDRQFYASLGVSRQFGDGEREQQAANERLKGEGYQYMARDKFSLRLAEAKNNTDKNPSQAQKESGNYRKGHIRFGGYNYTIENPQGSYRSGVDENGKKWKQKMNNTYGYILGTKGKDGDHLDMFINDKADLDSWNGNVYVVDQVLPDGSFDEHKVMYGFDSEEEARKAYLSNYEQGWQGLGNITGVSKEDFDRWLEKSGRKTKAFGEYKNVKPESAESPKTGAFGTIYTQFRGKAQEAFDFLASHGSGDLLGVFHREGVGDIDAVWGDKGGGLDHIIRKHIGDGKSFHNIVEAANVIDDIIKTGSKAFENGDKIVFKKGSKLVTIRKNVRNKGKKIADKNWVLTAYDELSADGDVSAIAPVNQGQAARTTGKSQRKDTTKPSYSQKKNVKSNKKTPFSLKNDRTLAGVHNITEEKLLKAIKQGGLANPSVAVIDSSKQNHDDYGDISLILPSDKVAKRTGKNAGTWQGDAWTPTYPQVERQMSNKGAEKASNDVGSVPSDMYSEVRRGLDRWLDGGEENSAMAYMFLHEKGVAPEPKKIRPKFSDEAYNELKSITAGDFNIYGIGKADAQKVLGMYIDAKFDGDKDLYEEKTKAWLERNKSIVDAGANGGMRYAIAKENVELYDEYGFNYKGVQTFVRDVEYDHRKTGVDMNATLNEVEDYIKTNNLTDEFNTWMEGKEKEYGIKEVIFDGFTPSGNRRYVPNTLENVSKIMKKQGRNGSTGISVSFQNFAARLMPSYGTLKDIRSKKGLLTSDREKLDKFREKWSNVFFELGMKCQPDATGTFDDYGLARLSEAAMTSDPQAYLKKEYNVDFSDEDTKRLKEMVKAIKEESPAMYFETKFERPVGFDEFSSAVVPTTASNEVKQALQNAGVQIYEYDKEKEGDRSRAFNEAINSSDNIRFSLDKDKGTVASPSKPSKAEAVLRDAVIDRLRENGMEVITDVAEGQKVLDEANGRGKLQMGDAPETFAERLKQAVENRGVVMPWLNETYVEVVKDIPRHGYTGTITEATREAIDAAKRKYAGKELTYNNYGVNFNYTISANAIEICLSPKHQNLSANKGIHLALAEHLEEVINNSIEVEEHPDYVKNNGTRGNNGSVNTEALMHRFYGVAVIDGTPFRIMTLMREGKDSATSNGIHSYAVQKIEVLDNDLPSTSNGVGSIPQVKSGSLYPLAKLLKGVEKAYDKGKYLLEESKKRSAGLREQRVYHGSGADGVRFFRTANGEAYGFTVGGRIYVDPRIATSETPVHEYAHLWASALRSGNAEEWQNVVGLMKDSKVWDEVKGRYPELKTDDEIADEVIATYSGRRGAERLREEQRKIAEGDGGVFEKAEAISALEKVKRALKMFWKGVADFLHIHYKSAEEVADRVMKDLLEGVDPRKMGDGVDRQLYASLGVSRALGEEAAEGGPRYASLALSEQQLDGDDTIRFSLRQEPAPKVTKKGYAVFIYKKLKNGGYKLVPKMLSNDPGAPAQTWLNADTGYMKRDENGEPLQNTNGRASVSVNGSQAGGNKSNKLAWRPGKHLAMYPNASQFKSPDGTIPKDVIFFEVEYAADPDLHKQYQRNAWELGMNDNGQYRNNQGGLPYIPKDSYYLYRTNSISEGATPMIITGAYKINRALTDAEAKELNQNAGGMWCPRKGGDLTEEKLKDMGLDDKGLKKMTESFDMDIIKESHDESDEARLLPGYKSREINWEDKDLIHSIEENGQDINDYRDGYVAPEHSEEPTIRFSLDKDKGTVVSPSKPSKAEAVLRDAVIDRLRENGMEVITDVAEGQKVLDEANGDVREMSFGEPYDYEAYPLGRVEPNLADREVMVVRADADHGFMNYKEAKAWAKQHVAKVYNNEETGGKGDVRISNAAIDKFMSQSAVDKSDGKDVHMSVLKVLPEVLKNSIDVETHPDFLKGEDGKRRSENGMNKDVLVHRCYGAVSIDGKPYRVKITLKENVKTRETTHTHSYEATKIELLAGQHGDVTMTSPRNSNSSKQVELSAGTWENQEGPSPNTNNSISAAKLLENVVMSYNPGEKVLDASKKRSAGLREQRIGGADGLRFFRTANGEAYGFTVGGRIYVDPRIATSETPVHEYAHLWASALRSGNAEEWQNVVGLMKDSKVWDEVKGRYPELKTDDEIADEVIATYSGRRGAERLREEQRKIAEGDGGVFEKAEAISALEKVKRALKMFWKGVADFLHIHYKSAEEVADRVMKDLLEGVDPRKMGETKDGGVRFNAKQKRALETASLGNAPRSLTVVSSATGAKILNSIDKLVESLEKSATQPKTFIGNVAKALGASRFGSGSEYATFETKNGDIVTIRLANHNAHVSGFDHNGKDNGISIVISPKPNEGITNDGNAHITEFYYDSIKLRRADGKPLAEIVRSIKQALYSGEFKDTTGLAERQEVNGEDVIRYQFIGEKGAAEADHAEEVSVRLDNLSVAREMEAEKKDAKAIKMATGWERGADGKWRYEIADLKEFDRNGNLLYRKHHPDYARYIELQDKDLKNLLEDGEKLTDKEREEYEALSKKYESDKFGGEKLDNIHTLEAYVDAPELFKAYPELRNVRVTFKDTGGWETASYYAISDVIDFNVDDVGEIVVNTGKVTANMRTKELKSVFLHEIQHAIQVIEGFAEGGSPQYMKGLYSDYFLQDYSSSQLHELAELRRIAENKVKRGEYKRMSYAVKNVIKAAKEHGFYPTWAESFDNNPNSVTTVYDTLVKFPSEILDKAVLIDEKDLYRRVAGEVEARNVQERMGMSAEERRASLAAETEDVAREDQIFLMGNGVSEMGSRVGKRMAEIGEHYEDKALTDEERPIVDVFCGRNDNLKVSIERDGKSLVLMMRQGSENGAGTKHCLYRHYGTGVGYLTADDILKIPYIMANGFAKEKLRGKSRLVEYTYKDEQGCEYTLLTEKKKGFEIFNDFYTNRKASSLSTFNTSEDAHTGSDNALIGAKLGNVSETAKESEGKDRQHYASLGVSRSLDKEAGEGEPRWASLGLSEQQLDGDDTIRFSLNYDKWNREMASWLKRNRLPKNAQRPVVPQREAGESDLHFAGRLAKYNQDKALWNTAPKYEGHLSSGMTARGEFNYELQRGAVLKRIAIQDSMLAIRKAQEAIARHSGLLKVGTFEDAYMAENNSHGKAKNEFEQYDQEYLEPLRKWFNVMMKRLDGSYNNVTNYMIAKHGLERNAHMAFMAALEAEAKKAIDNTQPDAKRLRAQMVHDAYKQYKADSRRLINDADYQSGKYDYAQWRRTDDAIRKSYCSNYESFRYNKGGVVRDYAGLSSLFQNETDFEEKAAELCADIESKNGHETGELWDAVRQATRQILKNSHDAGMMSDETYDYVRGMYEHYIPLRGWNDSAADEVWDYAGGGRGVFNAALKEAHGRQSLADDPVAYIMNMAESGFLVNNRNWVKQHFLTMAMNHPTDLLTVSKAWYVKTKDQFGNEVWIPASPNIPADETDPAVIQAALDAFQTKMEQMEQSGDATQQRGSLNIEYPQTKSEEREHEVRVMKNGEEYVIYVNGDPQLAQALNNTRAMRVREHEGLFEKACAWLGRKMAAVYTSLSPLFVPSNWARDTTMTLASTAIREDARYNWLLRTKFMRPDVQMRMFGLVKEYQNGKLREKVKSRTATKTEENFWNFMINGGETGFVSTMDVDAFREKIQRDLKDMGRTRLNPVKIGHAIADSVEYINRVIEDSNRFAIYQTSIEYGRGIEEAVQDAKNVTLNFNRKGTGEMGMSAIRQLYLFINPAIQSLQTLGALAKEHKAKFTAVTSAWMASGMLVPLFNELMFNLASAVAGGGGDDDDEFNPKDEYWKFSSFDRRNNCILWIPFTHNFIKIPLAQEFRGFYGIGDMVASAMWGGENAKESWSNYAADLMGQIIDLSPLDPVSYDGNVLVSLMPNAIRPLVEIAQNVTFTGKPIYRESDFNKYDPSFKKAYAGTPDFLLRYSKWMNSIGNKYPEAQQGPVEQTAVGRYANNPAVIDHLLKSYLGGMYTLGSQIAGAITKASDEETRKDFKTADIPFFSKFVANPNDRPQSKNKGDAYWQEFEKYQRSSHTLGVIRQDARKTGNFSVLEDFYKSEEYKEMKEYEPKAKQRKEEQKYERLKEEGNADLYQPHQQTGEDVYKRHSTPADDFEDTKASILYQKIKPAKDIFDLADVNTPSGMDTFNKYYDLAEKVETAQTVKKEMNAIVKSFVNDEHKATFDPDKMKEYRALRKQYLQLVEDGNRMFEKIKAQRN